MHPRCEGERTVALLVLAIATIEIWGSVPTGLAVGLPGVWVWLLTVAGALASVSLVTVAGDALRDRLVRRFGHGGVQRRGRLYGIWVRWGVPGWGLMSPLVFAPPMGTALGLALGAPRNWLWAWMTAGVILWTTVLVAVGALGLAAIHAAT